MNNFLLIAALYALICYFPLKVNKCYDPQVIEDCVTPVRTK